MIELRLLGTLDLKGAAAGAADALLGKRQPTALLAYLALCSPSGFQRRDHLATLFWPETAQQYARANLRKLLLVIRSALGKSIFDTRGDEEVRLDTGALWCDAIEFSEAVRDGRLVRAKELYKGLLMPGFLMPGGAAYQEWLDTMRRQYCRDALKMILGLADTHLRNGEHTAVGSLARVAGAIDAELQDERDLRKLIELFDRIGDRASAVDLYERFRVRLERDYRSLPARETRALIERIKGE